MKGEKEFVRKRRPEENRWVQRLLDMKVGV